MIIIPIGFIIFILHIIVLGVFILMTYIAAVEDDPIMFWLMIILSYWWYIKACPIFRNYSQYDEEENGGDSE